MLEEVVYWLCEMVKKRNNLPFCPLMCVTIDRSELPYQEDRNSHPCMGLYKSCSFLDLHMCQHRNFHIPCTPCCLGIPDLQDKTKTEYVTDVFIRSLKLLCHCPSPSSSFPLYLVCKTFYPDMSCLFKLLKKCFTATFTLSFGQNCATGKYELFHITLQAQGWLNSQHKQRTPGSFRES